MAEPKRTTKYVAVTLALTFHGDYVGADEIAGRVEGWIDSCFNDRDDLRTWSVLSTVVKREVTGDPEGYDS